ncbi:very short patch repair endonuclease [Cribrihabitans sp. XS_ASV171]
MEFVDPTRSKLMSRVRGKDTKPEMIVRRLLHAAGYRYRLHASDLPGKPDIVFRNRKKAILVHGCFWHRHPGCRKATTPKTRAHFWSDKFEANMARDTRNLAALKGAGWEALVVWECETNEPGALFDRLVRFLAN